MCWPRPPVCYWYYTVPRNRSQDASYTQCMRNDHGGLTSLQVDCARSVQNVFTDMLATTASTSLCYAMLDNCNPNRRVPCLPRTPMHALLDKPQTSTVCFSSIKRQQPQANPTQSNRSRVCSACFLITDPDMCVLITIEPSNTCCRDLHDVQVWAMCSRA